MTFLFSVDEKGRRNKQAFSKYRFPPLFENRFQPVKPFTRVEAGTLEHILLMDTQSKSTSGTGATDTAHSCGALTLSVVLCKGAWQCHFHGSACMLLLFQLAAKQNAECSFHILPFLFFCKNKKSSSDFFPLAKTGTNIGIS